MRSASPPTKSWKDSTLPDFTIVSMSSARRNISLEQNIGQWLNLIFHFQKVVLEAMA